MRDVTPSTSLWRVAVIADGVSQAAYAAALEDSAESLSTFELAPGGPWKIEALTQGAPDRAALEARLALAAAALGRIPPSLVIERLPDADWLAENRRAFPPLRVGRYFVHGSHHAGGAPAGSRVIALDAGIAFGSGEHATTRGCLLALDRLAKRGRVRRALDLGCGSGILAIALARSGVAHVLASDIDADAVRVAGENARRNGVASHVRVVRSDGFARLPRRRDYDLVVANILAKPLCRLAGGIARSVRRGGTVILSGLLAPQEVEVRAAYHARRLALAGRFSIAGWQTLVLRRR